MPWSQVEHDDKRQHDVHNGSNGTTAEFVKAYLKPGAKLVPIQMFGYWVYSVTVEESTFVAIMTDSRANSVTSQGVYKKFPVTEAGKEIRVPTTMDLTNFLQLETLPQQGTNCKSPLMNWWLRNGPR
jgi:hypothetical protein